MKIYTKTGDKGKTSLANGVRVCKSAKRLDAYGTADELNSFVGLLRAKVGVDLAIDGKSVDEQLGWLQNRLFDIGAILAGADMILSEDAVYQIEVWIDQMQEQLPPLREFILPGGSETVAICHVCRTITRRLEREMISWCDAEEIGIPDTVLCFVNRLSDYCFVLARCLSKEQKIVPFVWKK